MDATHAGAVSPLIDAVLAGGLLISVVTDVRLGKIFDRVTVPCLLVGLFLNSMASGWAGAAFSVEGMAAAVGMALAATLIAGRGLGGGDVKLLAAVGALRGPDFVMWAALFAALSGPFLCLVPLLRSGTLRYTLRNFTQNALSRFVFHSPIDIAAGSRGGKQPFGVAIAVGVVLALARLACS